METKPQSNLDLRRLWTNERARGIASQVLLIGGLGAFVLFIVSNTAKNLDELGLDTGFDFLADTAFFEINQTLIEYSSTSTFGRALLVGLLNTLVVSVAGIVSATIIGFFAGVLRLSNNWLASRLAGVYVETTRNIPLLLQIIFWWTVLTGLPRVADSLSIGDTIFLNNRGMRLPAPVLEPGFGLVFASMILGIVVAIFVSGWATRRRISTGQPFPALWVNLALIVVFPFL